MRAQLKGTAVRLLAGLALLFGADATAHAQAESFPTMPTRYTPGQIFRTGQLVLSQYNLRSLNKARRAPVRTPAGGSSPHGNIGSQGPSGLPARTASNDTTTFRPAAQTIMPQTLARGVASRPSDRAELERFFADLLENYKGKLRRRGVVPNDVSRAASFMISASYAVCRDGQQLSEQQFSALREQVREAFLEDPSFMRQGDRERQRAFESFAITGAFLDIGYQLARQRGDDHALAELRQVAEQQLQDVLGVSAERVVFTEGGIVYR